MTYSWKEDEVVKFNDVEYSNGVSIEKVETEQCDVETTSGKYSCARIVLHLDMTL
jgi:hypothetical protein